MANHLEDRLDQMWYEPIITVSFCAADIKACRPTWSYDRCAWVLRAIGGQLTATDPGVVEELIQTLEETDSDSFPD